ncbi:MAG TPA: hypothetical protein VGU63_05960 [Candidatus Acidoferrales bacterium]|nr:hypothetical protein [Candidatus Acidoferrales bacterium]
MKTACALAMLGSLGLLLSYSTVRSADQTVSPDPKLLSRHYRDGEKPSYHMTATNKDRTRTTSYEARADGIVKKNTTGDFYEEYQWSNLLVNGHALAIPSANAGFHQMLSLDPRFPAAFPDLRQAYPPLIAPMLDFMTFYVDLGLAIRQNGLDHPNDHVYIKVGKPNSWAAGYNLLLGEDSIDFDITLQSVDRSAGIATLLVRHVPPARPQIHLPVAWMQKPVADTPNNWVEVGKNADGAYTASVGKETFDDVIKLNLTDGRILSATMDNPVEVLERKCIDAALTSCSDPIRYQIRRQIEITENAGDGKLN